MRLASQDLTNVDYRLVPLDHPVSDAERAEYATVPRYVAVADEFPDRSLDLGVVDGHYRTNCIRRCLGKLRPNGLLMVDDVNMWPTREEIPVPAGLASGRPRLERHQTDMHLAETVVKRLDGERLNAGWPF